MTCTCNVGPGKFEGESCLTFMAYQQMLLGAADITIGRYDFFKAPFNFDADQCVVEAAREYGYCDECIEERSDAFGMVISEDDQGFVYCTTYPTEAEYDTAQQTAEEEESESTED